MKISDWKKQIHPELARRVEQVITTAAAAGHILKVVSGYRSHEEQNALYAQGRSRPGKRVTNAIGGQSWHNFGLAVDLAPVIGGEVCWDENRFDWSLIGKWARAAGLEWGGDWHSFKDRPHVQLTFNLSLAAAQRLYHADLRTLRNVWKYITNHAPTSETSAENVAEKIDELRTDTIDDLGKIRVLTKPAAPQVGNPTDKPALPCAPQPSKPDSASQPQDSGASAPAQPDSSIDDRSPLETLDAYIGKLQNTVDRAKQIQNAFAPLSRSSWAMTLLSKVLGVVLFVFALVQDNWKELLIAVLLIGIGAYIYSRAKDRAVAKQIANHQ